VETIADWAALQRVVSSVPRGAADFSTNLFVTQDQFQRWSAHAPLRTLSADGAALVLRAERDFHRVYHLAESAARLTAALATLPAGTYVSDLIGKGDQLERMSDAYAAAGFAEETFLRRMSRDQATAANDPASIAPADVDPAERATPADAPAVVALLERLLDPRVDQIPDAAELAEAAAEGRLLVVRNGEALEGMLLYDLKGRLAHLRFWHVDPMAHGAGIGRRLMAVFLADCAQAARIVLWVIGTNDRSIAIYRHYGFVEDALLDRIVILHKDQN
jgi:ribosomal protein S18 acetylase RimI-like enzyme